MLDKPSPKAVSLSRDMVFEEVERVGRLLESYARSAAEAAFRGDEKALMVSLQQARLCLINMIQNYKDLGNLNADGAR